MLLPSPEQLIKGRVYKLECRNLSFGVWDGVSGFIGVRTKFGSQFLDTEDHWNINQGTVRGAEDTGIDIPSEVPWGEKGMLQWFLEFENPDFELGADAIKIPEPDGSGSMRA